MPILNYTTSIPSEKTIGEIQKCLVSHGAHKIVTDYENGLPSAVTFVLVIQNSPVGFALPANYQGVLNAMKKDRKVPQRLCTDEQALRVSWRIVKDWVEAQMAIVDAKLCDVGEVFMPYAITRSGSTLYKHMLETNMKLLN